MSSHSWFKEDNILTTFNIPASKEDGVIEAMQIVYCDEKKGPQWRFLSFITLRQEGKGAICKRFISIYRTFASELLWDIDSLGETEWNFLHPERGL